MFQRGGGGHTVSNIIVMAFSPRNIVGCFLKKGLQRGGHGYPRTPPRYALGIEFFLCSLYNYNGKWHLADIHPCITVFHQCKWGLNVQNISVIQ